MRLQACQMLYVAVAGPSVAATQQTTGPRCVSLNDNRFLLAHSLSPCASPVSDEIAASVQLAQYVAQTRCALSAKKQNVLAICREAYFIKLDLVRRTLQIEI